MEIRSILLYTPKNSTKLMLATKTNYRRKVMRTFCFLFVVFICSQVFANDRIGVAEAPQGQKQAEELVESVAEKCNSKDFSGFMDCFTKKKASQIRSKMSALFQRHSIEMRIISVELQSSDQDSLKFAMKYSWDSNQSLQKSVFTADVIAKLEDGKWKVSEETLKDAQHEWKRAQEQVNFGGAGQIVLNPRSNDDFLPRDVGRSSGGGCANGRCGL